MSLKTKRHEIGRSLGRWGWNSEEFQRGVEGVRSKYIMYTCIKCYATKGLRLGGGGPVVEHLGGSPSVGLRNLILLPQPAGTTRRPDLYSEHPDCMRHCIHSQVTGGKIEAQEGYGTCHRSHG